MLKSCTCGQQMELSLRTVIFAKKVNITNVPVYSCAICGRNDVFHGVKDDVGRLISKLGTVSDSRSIPFDQMHEWAGLLSDMRSQMRTLQPADVAKATEERTNNCWICFILQRRSETKSGRKRYNLVLLS